MPLTVTYDEIKRAITRSLGYQSGTLPSNEQTILEDSIREGLRKFYQPAAVAEDEQPHVWSFLRAPLDLTTVPGEYAVELPEDFSQLMEGLTFSAGSALPPLTTVSERDIRAMRASKDESGTPKYAAVSHYRASRSRYELLLYPTPDEAYSLHGEYRFEPDDISSTDKYPLGGALHSATIMTACLVAADEAINPEAGPSKYQAKFEQLLAASVQQDRALQTPAGDALWPVTFPDGDALTVTKRQLQAIVARALQFPPDSGAWTHAQRSTVTEVIRTGLRNFYSPPILPQEANQHQWSFLRPVRRLELVAGEYDYQLPPDFAGLRGPLSYVPGTAVLYPDIEVTGEERLRTFLQRTNMITSRPLLAAVYPDQVSDAGQRWRMLVYPVPDQDYSIQLRYSTNPWGLADDEALPIGDQAHVQTVIESCLAAAEGYGGQPGLHMQLFMERLRASVSFDRQISAPDTHGYNGDGRGPRRHASPWDDWHDLDTNIVEYLGYSP